MGNIGFPEMLVIFVVALLVFGPKRLPELGRSLGKGLTEFRRASSDLRHSIEREIDAAEIEQAIADTKKASSEPPKETATSK
jgi:sec-independent protein translocase protein TatA